MNNNYQDCMDAYEPDNTDQVFQEQPTQTEDVHMSEGCGCHEMEHFAEDSEFQEPEFLSEDCEYQEPEYLSEDCEYQEPEQFSEDSGGGIQPFGVEAFPGDLSIAPQSIEPLSVAPTIVNPPSNNAVLPLRTVELRWNLVANARYRLAVRNVDTNVLVAPNTDRPAGTNSFPLTPNQLTPGHRYRFAIASIVGNVERWTDRYFSMAQLNAPTITSPTVNSVIFQQNFVLRWNAVSGATGYRLAVRNVTTNALIRPNITLGADTTQYIISSGLLQAGHRYRFAIASLFGSTERWSDRYFDVAGVRDGRLLLAGVQFRTDSLGHNLGATRELREIDRITVHHTVTTNQNPTIANVNGWWPSNWTRAGYHFIIRGDGSIWQLVPLHTHSNGADNPLGFTPTPNARSIHIAFVGDFRAPALPTAAARSSFGFLCRHILESNQFPNLRNTDGHVVGHRLWRNGGANDCPGIPRTTYLSWI
ncbi:MAG: peptidoglycan recognition protein family protein [Oscillospiraceae bacterium]|nr:peptidoglycan recognition protein family protein [Oscillospiraceae bacterium]